MIKNIIAFVWAILTMTPGIIATRVTYDWDGEFSTQNKQPSYVDFFGGLQNIAADEHVTDSGWIDITNVGRPFCQCEIQALGTGLREVEVVIEYAVRQGVKNLLTVARERRVNANEVDYEDKVLLWLLPLNKKLGCYCRVKWIYNKGAMDINVQCLAPSSAQPVGEEFTVIDREVVEENA